MMNRLASTLMQASCSMAVRTVRARTGNGYLAIGQVRRIGLEESACPTVARVARRLTTQVQRNILVTMLMQASCSAALRIALDHIGSDCQAIGQARRTGLGE